MQPGDVRARVEAEWQRSAEGEGGVLAPVIVQRRVAHLDRAVPDRVEHLQAGDDFAGGERLDLELVVGDVGHPLGKIFAAAIERIERLRPARGISPLNLRIRLCDRGRCDCARGGTDAGHFQEITTFHALPSPLLPTSSTSAAILIVAFCSADGLALLLVSETWLSAPLCWGFSKNR